MQYISSYYPVRPEKKMFGCTLPTNPDVQGRPTLSSPKNQFSLEIIFLQNFQALSKTDKKWLFFLQYS